MKGSLMTRIATALFSMGAMGNATKTATDIKKDVILNQSVFNIPNRYSTYRIGIQHTESVLPHQNITWVTCQ